MDETTPFPRIRTVSQVILLVLCVLANTGFEKKPFLPAPPVAIIVRQDIILPEKGGTFDVKVMNTSATAGEFDLGIYAQAPFENVSEIMNLEQGPVLWPFTASRNKVGFDLEGAHPVLLKPGETRTFTVRVLFERQLVYSYPQDFFPIRLKVTKDGAPFSEADTILGIKMGPPTQP